MNLISILSIERSAKVLCCDYDVAQIYGGIHVYFCGLPFFIVVLHDSDKNKSILT